MSTPQSDIIRAFRILHETLQDLSAHLQNDLSALPIWIATPEATDFIPDRQQVIRALNKLTPAGDSLAPQETFSCPGAIAGTAETFGLITHVNQAKTTLKETLLACQKTLGHTVYKVTRDTLIAEGYGLVKLMQAYRHFHKIAYCPKRIAWSMGSNSTNVVITQAKARELLLKTGQGEHIEIQLAKLNALGAHEKLAIQRSLKANWIVNITGQKIEGRSAFENLRTSLPVFYLHDPQLPLPDVCFSSPNVRSTTQPRADKLLENEAFLPSIHAFRYKAKS